MTLEYSSVRDFAQALGKVPIELRRQLRPQLREGGQEIVDDMRQRAAYSSRIPGAIGMTVSFSAKGGGVRFRVNARRAPHARVLELGNQSGRANLFRHPVFGDQEVWATQETRPFFFPALKAGRPKLHSHIRTAVQASLREVSR